VRVAGDAAPRCGRPSPLSDVSGRFRAALGLAAALQQAQAGAGVAEAVAEARCPT